MKAKLAVINGKTQKELQVDLPDLRKPEGLDKLGESLSPSTNSSWDDLQASIDSGLEDLENRIDALIQEL